MSAPIHNVLADQADRDRFATELERNFSVIAPAGVGKTTAIVARVAALAAADARLSDPVLPRLAVVTYTRKAAEEMQARARTRLLADGASPELLGRFSQAFFGTIHSLCLLVLKNYGHLVGLPSNLEQVTQPDVLWRQYLRSTDDVLRHLPPHAREPFLRHGSLANALELVPDLPPSLPPSAPLPPAPRPDISAILQAPDNKRSQKNIDAGKARAEHWLHALQHENGHLPLPEQKTGGKDFVSTFTAAFRPLCDWLGEATLALARGVAEDFRNYRKNLGQLTFDDMVTWAAAVLDHPQAGHQLRRQRWCIILDEAQDTDPTQFHILLGLAADTTDTDETQTSGNDRDDNDRDSTDGSSNDNSGNEAPDDTEAQPLPAPDTTAADARLPMPYALPGAGRFCMVGDPQQAIYGDRADLATYRNVHTLLTQSDHAEALQFTVTMRCDRAIVATANAIFPQLLRGGSSDALSEDGPAPSMRQVDYVPLHPRPNAGAGNVSRMYLQLSDSEEPAADGSPATSPTQSEAGQADDSDASSTRRKGDSDRQSARALARELAANGPQAFGVQDWSEVAILCVRNDPLATIAEALEEEGLPVQNHSRLDIRGDSPAYAWLAALSRVMAEPQEAFEVAGILREVFGIADGALYAYLQAAGSGGADAANRREHTAGNLYHPLSLCSGALALSNPADLTTAADPADVAKASDTSLHSGSSTSAVAAALEQLRSVHKAVITLPLREGIHCLSERLHLPERLASIPDGRTASHLQQLEDLLLQAANCEEQGFDWLQWADALRDGFEARSDSAEPLRGHIQLLSCHKSKGLQWPVVLLANLFRTVGYARANFPRLLSPSRSEAPRVAFASGHGHSQTEATLKLKAAQELQRLAYVACTRAQRSMVWVDDSTFYDKPEGSFADALGIASTDTPNANVWASLPPWQPLADTQTHTAAAEPNAPAATATTVPQDSTASAAADHSLVLTTAGATGQICFDFTEAAAGHADRYIPQQQATTPEIPRWGESFASSATNAAITPAFFRRVLPSSLADHNPRGARRTQSEPTTTVAPADDLSNTDAHSGTRRGHARNEPDGSRALPAFAELEEAAAATAGADYGNWWHKSMELAPWGKDDKAWFSYSETALNDCPDPQRGLHEWEQFLDSPLHAWLNRPEVIVRCELPLLWPDAAVHVAYDGFIDLVARDSSNGKWLIIDWKTDRLHAFDDPSAELLRCYGPQLDAYRRALEALFCAPVAGHLYNTPTGRCAPEFVAHS